MSSPVRAKDTKSTFELPPSPPPERLECPGDEEAATTTQALSASSAPKEVVVLAPAAPFRYAFNRESCNRLAAVATVGFAKCEAYSRLLKDFSALEQTWREVADAALR